MKAAESLQKCDGRRTAVVLRLDDLHDRVVIGHATSEEDPDLGSVLRVTIEDVQGLHELFLVESQWNGSVVDGTEYGCEYCLVPQSSPVG
jgi:hypothetical protein